MVLEDRNVECSLQILAEIRNENKTKTLYVSVIQCLHFSPEKQSKMSLNPLGFPEIFKIVIIKPDFLMFSCESKYTSSFNLVLKLIHSIRNERNTKRERVFLFF